MFTTLGKWWCSALKSASNAVQPSLRPYNFNDSFIPEQAFELKPDQGDVKSVQQVSR